VQIDEGEPLPDLREFAGIMAMGDPMGPYEDDRLPWLAAEKRLIAVAVGLRARALNSALIRVGDPVSVVDAQDGVGVVVLRGSRLLLGQRLTTHGYGTWSFPAGRPLPRESARACALREETGLEAANPRPIGLTHDGFSESRNVFRTTFVRVDAHDSEPIAREPEKTSQWHWFDRHELPRPLFSPVASLFTAGYEPAAADLTRCQD
jgi:8-oxo-dGTP diphosphatase